MTDHWRPIGRLAAAAVIDLGINRQAQGIDVENLPIACDKQENTRTGTGRMSAADDLQKFLGDDRFATVMADPPWRFQNRTGKIAPEHKRLARYPTMHLEEICALPVARHLEDRAHCYLWVPNALLPEGLQVLKAWGFEYKSNIIWEKVRYDGGPDGRGVGFYFRNVTEILLFGTRGKDVRTLPPGRRQVNFIEAGEPEGDLLKTRKREHSRKPDEQYGIIESCSWGPYLELFGRGKRPGWTVWGNQADDDYKPSWPTYAHNSSTSAAPAPAE